MVKKTGRMALEQCRTRMKGKDDIFVEVDP